MRGRGFIPSLSALRAFEAVAQGGNFVAAAKALNLSVGAVSHQVTSLEANLGVALFVRADARGRQTKLTKAGEELLATVESALDQLAEACVAVRRRRRSARRIINVSANAPTCSLWLAPRLARYALLNNRVDIRVSAVEGEPEMRESGLDLAIVRLRRTGQVIQRPISRDTYLMGETVFPVCSPRILDLMPQLSSDPRCLEKAQLLQEDNTDSPELGPVVNYP
jgi:LysR family transcriptional regulator, glycine cleavage system transcriptional activator